MSFSGQGFLRHESEMEIMERSEDEDEELRNLNLEGIHIISVLLYLLTVLISIYRYLPRHIFIFFLGTVSLNNNHIVDAEESNSKPITSNFKESPSLDQENLPPTSQIEGRKIAENAITFSPIDIPNSTEDYSLLAEKRKWSQVNSKRFLHQLGSGNDSSSDDEIKELFSGNSSSGLLSSSPPGKVTVLSKHSGFCAQVRPTDGHSRRKHRVIICDERPSLNFEKMQQVTLCFSKFTPLNRILYINLLFRENLIFSSSAILLQETGSNTKQAVC
jgi:hypothetical protein